MPCTTKLWWARRGRHEEERRKRQGDSYDLNEVARGQPHTHTHIDSALRRSVGNLLILAPGSRSVRWAGPVSDQQTTATLGGKKDRKRERRNETNHRPKQNIATRRTSYYVASTNPHVLAHGDFPPCVECAAAEPVSDQPVGVQRREDRDIRRETVQPPLTQRTKRRSCARTNAQWHTHTSHHSEIIHTEGRTPFIRALCHRPGLSPTPTVWFGGRTERKREGGRETNHHPYTARERLMRVRTLTHY